MLQSFHVNLIFGHIVKVSLYAGCLKVNRAIPGNAVHVPVQKDFYMQIVSK